MEVAGTVRQDADTKQTAIKTDLPGEHREWFVFSPTDGGWYTDGEREGVSEWPQLKPE